MKLLSKILHVLKFKLGGNALPLSSTVENGRRIVLEGNVRVDPGCVLKGGYEGDVSLFVSHDVRIRRNCYISATYGAIEIGPYSLIAHNCWIGGQGSTKIGSNTLIGPGVVIVSSNHDLTSDHFPAADAPEISSTIEIGSNTWIGANCTIVPGVKIGDNCIVGGGSVVTRDVPSNHFAAGNPAKIMRRLDDREGNLYKEAEDHV